MEENQLQRDKSRDEYLTRLGLEVLRFDSRVVLTETDAVIQVIYGSVTRQLDSKIPPAPPFSKEG
jgi:very-short-patch-repair endonuclease